ncbi:hypothetical protein [Pseudomonas sp. R151218B TE3479]
MYPFLKFLWLVWVFPLVPAAGAGVNVGAMVRSEQKIVNSTIGILFDNRPKN